MVKGSTMTIEQREKLSVIRTRLWEDPAYVKKMKACHVGTLGKKYSLATRRKMSRWQIGRKMSLEARQKMSLAKLGEKSPNWKGGITSANRLIRRKLMGWSNEVRQRDGFICQICGTKPKKRKNVHAHHIKPFAEYPELRFDISNGQTLCKKCHRKIHSSKKLTKI